jgi:hypothetical protein
MSKVFFFSSFNKSVLIKMQFKIAFLAALAMALTVSAHNPVADVENTNVHTAGIAQDVANGINADKLAQNLNAHVLADVA